MLSMALPSQPLGILFIPPQLAKCLPGSGGPWLLACKAVLFPSSTEVVLVAWPPPQKKTVEVVVVVVGVVGVEPDLRTPVFSCFLFISLGWNLISALLCFLASFSSLFLRGKTCCPANGWSGCCCGGVGGSAPLARCLQTLYSN